MVVSIFHHPQGLSIAAGNISNSFVSDLAYSPFKANLLNKGRKLIPSNKKQIVLRLCPITTIKYLWKSIEANRMCYIVKFIVTA